MRATEFIKEEKQGKLHKDQSGPMKTAVAFRDQGVDRLYNLNRVMMAAAMADGKSRTPVEMDASSWIEKNNTVHPYTDEEHNMIHQAFGAVDSNYHSEVSDPHSIEPDTIHKVSPVAGFKGYPR
jgi:hypothetical protein